MSHIFISHVEEDKEIAIRIARELEKAGYKTWYYERDSIGGVSHIDQTSQAIREGGAVILIASAYALESNEIDLELYAAHRNNKPIVPLLVNIFYEQLQTRRPKWDAIFKGAVAIETSSLDVISTIPRIIQSVRSISLQDLEDLNHAISGKTAPQIFTSFIFGNQLLVLLSCENETERFQEEAILKEAARKMGIESTIIESVLNQVKLPTDVGDFFNNLKKLVDISIFLSKFLALKYDKITVAAFELGFELRYLIFFQDFYKI